MYTNAAQNALAQSDIEDLENEAPEINVTASIPNAAPAWVVVVLPLATAILGFTAGLSYPKSISAADTSTSLASKQYEYQLKISEYDHDWRTKVINACVEAGRIPFVLNGNVDCKAK